MFVGVGDGGRGCVWLWEEGAMPSCWIIPCDQASVYRFSRVGWNLDISEITRTLDDVCQGLSLLSMKESVDDDT